ncbi:MAG: hypothetical protein ACOX6H_00975 [Christensenellales bacterium]|jgi:uncharacterized membrane protein YkvI
MKKTFATTMLIVSTIMGAGFCSGKEIVSYFARFGLKSLFFVPFLFLIYFFIFKLFLHLGAKENFNGIEDINKRIFKKGAKFSYVLFFIVYLIFSSAMFAGIKEISLMFNWKPLTPLLLGVVFCLAFIVLLKPFNALKKINSVLGPFLIVLMFVLCLLCFNFFGFNSSKLIQSYYNYLLFFNPIIYACQGLALAYFILVKSGEGLNKKQINASAFLSTLILCVLQVFVIIVINFNPEVLNQAMPLAALSIKIGLPFDVIYIFTLLVAITTTLLSTSRPLNEIVKLKAKNTGFAAFLSLLIPFVLSIIGFDRIIIWFYPIIGVIGFVILALVVYDLAFVSFFKYAHKKIHNASKHTK